MTQALHTWSGIAGVSSSIRWVDADAFEIEPPLNNDIDIDNDGVLIPRHVACVDLSGLGSYVNGRQLPMTANYRVTGIRIALLNQDDAVDNDNRSNFTGLVRYMKPTKHSVDAMQAHRKLHSMIADQEAFTANSQFMPSDDRYRGFRFGFYRQDDVQYPSELTIGSTQHGLSIEECMDRYNNTLDDDADKPRALFWRRTGTVSDISWSATNGNSNASNASAVDNIIWEYKCPSGYHLDVLGGLLGVMVTHSSTDQSGTVDDDYQLRIDVDVAGWTSW